MTRPSVAVFDVNETLSNITPLARRFADIGLPKSSRSCGSRRCFVMDSH